MHVVNAASRRGRRELEAQQLALYHRGGDHLRFHSVGGAECIVLADSRWASPPSYGPFVMNDRSQIQRCIADYRPAAWARSDGFALSGYSQEDDGWARGFD